MIAYGGFCVVKGALTVGSLVAFHGIAVQLFEPLSGAAELYARAQKALASIRQVRVALAMRPAVVEARIARLAFARDRFCRSISSRLNSRIHNRGPSFEFLASRFSPAKRSLSPERMEPERARSQN